MEVHKPLKGGEIWQSALVYRRLRELSSDDLREHPDDHWHVDGLVGHEYYPHSYDAAFADVLHGKPIVDLLAERKKDGRTTHVLDLFGGAYFIPPGDFNLVDSLTGVRMRSIDAFLTEEPTTDVQMSFSQDAVKWAREISSFPRRKIIEESVYTAAAWRAMRERMREVGAEGYDLITCKPVAAFSFLRSEFPWEGKRRVLDPYETEDIARTFMMLLGRTMHLMTQGSTLLSEVPDVLSDWFRENIKYPEDVVQEGGGTFRMSRGLYELGREKEIRYVLRLDRTASSSQI